MPSLVRVMLGSAMAISVWRGDLNGAKVSPNSPKPKGGGLTDFKLYAAYLMLLNNKAVYIVILS